MKVSIPFGAAVLAALLLACGTSAPPRPASVPAQATWTGTRQAGVFIEVGPQDREAWIMRVYDDRTGVLKVEGPYVLQGMARAVIQQVEITGFDGRAIQLSDGAVMVPRPKR